MPYIVGNKRSYLLKTIKYIKNNEKGIRNQILPNNIGCHMEGNISKSKSVKGRGCKIYNKLTFNVVYNTHFGDCKKTRKNNKIYNLKYKNIIKNDTYINKNYKIDTLKNSLNKTL